MPYIGGESRDQVMLLPEVLDDYVGEDNPVRFIDPFVEGLDLGKLGFGKATPSSTGRPAYRPGDLLRLYVYGYLNQIRSSRRLEKETRRNLELIWLMRKLTPDHKTIADFRKDNLKGIRSVCREFSLLCKQMGLFGGELIAVDGSKFKAVNGKERNFTTKKLVALVRRVDQKIDEYLKRMEEADKEEGEEKVVTKEELKEKIAAMGKRRERYKEIEKRLEERGEGQISMTDPDSRLMKTRQGTDVCYNVQIAVDDKNKMIVAHEVTNSPSDQGQLADIGKQAKEALGVAQMETVADMGYYDCRQVKECEEEGITVYIEKPPLSRKTGLFTKEDFIYNAKKDVYRCPAGAELTYRTEDRREQQRLYATGACIGCSIKSRCTTRAKGRIIKRLTNEEVLDRMALRVRGHPEKLGLRKRLVEHPFGTMKRAMNQGYFLMKGKKKVAAEMSLTVLAYNIKRAMTVLGVEKLKEAVEG
jgi:transposase